MRFSLLFTLSLASYEVFAWNNGLALTPPMGWASDLIYNCTTLTEDSVKEAAHFMSVNALNKAGYKYVILGDCWQNATREANGTLLPDPARFPSGIFNLQANITLSNLTLGITQSSGAQSCIGGKPGSQGYNQRDAQDWSSWGI